MKIEEYPTGQLEKEIKSTGWLLLIFSVALAFFIGEIITDVVKGNNLDNTLLFATIAVAAGSTPMFQKRKKMIKELKSRQ